MRGTGTTHRGTTVKGAAVDRLDLREHPVVDTIDEPSMRVFEYAICALAGIAALLLGMIH
jgi:hypothetical protein